MLNSNAQWVYFPDTTNRILIGDVSVSGNAITIEALINMKSYNNPTQEANDIVSKHTGVPDLSYLLRPNTFAIKTENGFHSVSHTIPLCFDLTYHVAGSYDGDSIRYFINGEQVASTQWSGNLVQNSLITSIGNVAPIDITSNYKEQFIGYIDELRIWNIGRTSNELLNNMYELQNPVSQSGLVAYYKFNNGYENVQGNALYNGVLNGDSILNVSNPHFNGNVNTSFCFPTSTKNNSGKTNTISVYPNPVSSVLNIECKNTENSDVYLQLVNSSGITVLKQNFRGNQLAISTEQLLSGIYFLTLLTDQVIETKKILKE